MRRDAFQKHLADAISLNQARRSFYASRTGGRSRWLSDVLIAAERALLPAAWFADQWAARFNRAGVPVVTGDFVSMEKVRAAAQLPRYTGRMTPEQRRHVARVLRWWRRRLARRLWANDLCAACRATEVTLHVLTRLETCWGAHLAMSRHIVESAGYAALHGIAYAQRSDGDTRRLTGVLVLGQAALAPWAARLDREAQRSHRRGVGIVVNDVPAIPFLPEWSKEKRRRREG